MRSTLRAARGSRGGMRAIAFLLVGLAGCGLDDAGPPDRSCRADRDCFRAQGETCNQETHQCEAAVDASIDAAPPIDAAVEIDATFAPAEDHR